ncbi:hypothetical protein WA026_011928 [Henosepilachna vigintioctopunctata]|uniref:SKP1 component POZ domain-containing protein n=1 Tax=Henosepilachna vigintioctopunctata TaxID=420089 RepID=A0AAW1UHM1_9CUCU
MTIVKLRTSDGKLFEVDHEVIQCSQVLFTMFQLLGTDDEEIPIPNVTSSIFKKVIEWAEFHISDSRKSGEIDDGRKILDSSISGWDANYVKVHVDTLYEIMQAADYLEINNLSILVCKAFANILKTSSPEELIKTFSTVSIKDEGDGGGD